MTHDPSDAEMQHAAEASNGRRCFVVNGVAWSVRVAANPYDRRTRPDLIFDSDTAVRRVRNYPSNWRELPDDLLFALSHER